VGKFVCLKGITLNYISSPCGSDAFAFWIALGPFCPIAYNFGVDLAGLNFLQAGVVVYYKPGSFFVYCLKICEYCAGNGKTLFCCKLYSGSIDYGFYLNIEMINKTYDSVTIAMYKMPCYKLCHCFKKVVNWYLPYYPHSAYSIVEAPTNPSTNDLRELPLISGGAIKDFYFLYYNGYGPGKPVYCNCEFVALEMCLTQMKANNNVCVTLARAVCNGNANECFYFNFRNTENGATTCGL
jgi:hypothetical protein